MRLMPWRFFFRSIAEDLPLEEIVDELRDFDERFVIILHKHLAVLGWWCFLHLLVGAIALIFTTGAWWYFFLMNICWAIINFWIVLFIFDHSFLQRFTKGVVFQRFEVQHHLEKMLAFNVGFDVAYIFCGLFLLALIHHPNTNYPELWRGFGWAVIIQGIYLFIQDNVFHQLHRINFRKAEPLLEDLMESQIAYRQKQKEKNS